MIINNGLKKFQEIAEEVDSDLIVTREDETIKDLYLKNPFVELAIEVKRTKGCNNLVETISYDEYGFKDRDNVYCNEEDKCEECRKTNQTGRTWKATKEEIKTHHEDEYMAGVL